MAKDSFFEENPAVRKAIDDEHEKRWYVVNTYAGHENRVKENLEKRTSRSRRTARRLRPCATCSRDISSWK